MSSIVVLIARSASPFCADEYGAVGSCIIPFLLQNSVHILELKAPSVRRWRILLPVSVSALFWKVSKASSVVGSDLSARNAPCFTAVPASRIIMRKVFPPTDCTRDGPQRSKDTSSSGFKFFSDSPSNGRRVCLPKMQSSHYLPVSAVLDNASPSTKLLLAISWIVEGLQWVRR
jgi:hypothetical protein